MASTADAYHRAVKRDAHKTKLAPFSASLCKSTLVLPFWYQLTQIVPEERPLNGCRSSYLLINDFYPMLDSFYVHTIACHIFRVFPGEFQLPKVVCL